MPVQPDKTGQHNKLQRARVVLILRGQKKECGGSGSGATPTEGQIFPRGKQPTG